MRYWVGNFDFEHQLAAGLSYQRTKQLERINSELAAHLIPLADDQDAIVGTSPAPDLFLQELCDEGFPQVCFVEPNQLPKNARLEPWGWSRSVLRESETSTPNQGIPDLEAVRRVNSRAFAFEHATQHAPLEHAREILSLDDLRDAIDALLGSANQSCDRDSKSTSGEDSNTRTQWVVKADFGMSGRERVLGGHSRIEEPTERWIQRRLREGQRLFFEPWLDRLDELSVHWDILPVQTAEPRFAGLTKLLCDASGRFLGNRVLTSSALDPSCSEAIDRTRSLVKHVRAAGYFGPVGIDCMVHRSAAGPQLRITQDINARWSMGRVAIRAAELVGETQVTLIHYPTSWFKRIAASNSINVTAALKEHWPNVIRRAIRTTPCQIDQQTSFQTSVLLIE